MEAISRLNYFLLHLKIFSTVGLLLICILWIMPGCKSTSAKNEVKKLKNSAKKMTDTEIDWQSLDAILPDIEPNAEAMLKRGITRQDAVTLALLNNHQLQTDLESIGISKADLVQAGLYTNPVVYGIFQFPIKEPSFLSGAEASFTVELSDLWQIPLKKKIAEKDLEITSLKILSSILTIIDETKTAYNNALFQIESLKTIDKNLEIAKRIKTDVISLQKDMTGDMDTDLAQIPIYEWEIQKLDAQYLRDDALSSLCSALGIPPSFVTTIKLIDTLEFGSLEGLPKVEKFIEFALTHRPEMQIARLKIQRARDSVALERVNFIPSFSFGIDALKDSIGVRSVGPLMTFTLPLFDNNYAQIDRACYALTEAERQYEATKISIMNEVFKAFNNLDGDDEIIALHKKKLDIYNRTLPLAHHYLEKKNFLNVINTLQIYEGQYRESIAYLQSQTDTFNALADLEKAIGHMLHPQRDNWPNVLTAITIPDTTAKKNLPALPIKKNLLPRRNMEYA